MHFLMEPEKGLAYAAMSLEAAEKSQDLKAIADAHFLRAYVYFHNRLYVECQQPFERAFKSYEQLKDEQNMTYVCYYVGYAHHDRGDLLTAMSWFQKGLQIAESSEDQRLINISLNAKGPLHCMLHEYDEGLESGKRALEIAEENGFNLSSTYNQVALIQRMVGNYGESKRLLNLSWFHQGEDANYKNKAANLENLGEVFLRMGRFDSTLSCYADYQQVASENKDLYLEARGYLHLAEFHLELDNLEEAETNAFRALQLHEERIDSLTALDLIVNILIEQNELGEASRNLKLAETLTRTLNLSGQQISNLNHAGMIDSRNSDHHSALANFENALNLANELGHRESLPETYLNLSNAHFSLGQIKEASAYADSSLIVSRRSHYRQKLDEIYRIKGFCEEKLGNSQKALETFHQYVAIKDSLFSIETEKELAKLEIEYKVREQQAENALLKAEGQIDDAKIEQQTTIAIGLVIIILLITAISVILYRNNSRKEKLNEQLELEVQQRTKELTERSEELMEIRKAQELQVAKSRFFANVSHEFRTPLTLIQGTLDTVVNGQQVSGQVKLSLERAQRNGKQLLKLITELLDITRLGTQELPVDLREFHLGELIEDLIGNLEPLAEQKGIILSNTVQGKRNVVIKTDQSKLTKIVNNLLSNAVKFTPRNGNIELEILIKNEVLSITVSDDGLGIPTSELELIFERFYQVNQSEAVLAKTENYQPGSGIGLSLCKEYVELLGGQIGVKSPGKFSTGSSFWIKLPIEILNETHQTEQRPDERSIVEATSEGVRLPRLNHELLVVEDNFDLREFLKETLSVHYRVKTAENGQEAIHLLKTSENLPSLIITDVMMPVMDGFTFIEKIKSSDEFRHLPTMVLTARADLRDQLNALRIGVDDYITKPFQETDLKRRIDQLLGMVEYRTSAQQENLIGSSTEETNGNSPQLSREDHNWLRLLEEQALQLVTDFNYTAEDLAFSLDMSRANFFRKVKKITGLTVNQYIKEFRLQTARRLLEEGKVNSVKELSYTVGFKHVNYFSTSFENRFGQRPSAYLTNG